MRIYTSLLFFICLTAFTINQGHACMAAPTVMVSFDQDQNCVLTNYLKKAVMIPVYTVTSGALTQTRLVFESEYKQDKKWVKFPQTKPGAFAEEHLVELKPGATLKFKVAINKDIGTHVRVVCSYTDAQNKSNVLYSNPVSTAPVDSTKPKREQAIRRSLAAPLSM